MGIYIKGFRKPTYCQECPLTFDYDCMIQHEQRDSLIDQYKHCPLVEVKTPHGRLIDADAEYKALSEMKVEGEVFVTAVEFAKIRMEQVQTVIEAEVE